MAYIVLTKDAPAGSLLLLIDQDFLKSQIPSIIGLTYDRPGNFVTNKDFSKIYCRNASTWELVNAGGGGAAYLAGQGISISNNKISAAVDGTTISFNSAGQLVSAVSPDATTKNFTLANTTVVDAEKPGLKKAMTTGDSTEDTLVWTDGEITWSFEATNDDLLFGYGEVSCYSIETYDPFDPKIDYYLPFGFDETDTVKYKGMKWKVQTEDNIDTFTCIMIKQDGTEVTSEAQVITGCICHFEVLTNATNIHATAASGKLHDPINPLPHDKRLDNAFDEQGYVVVGNKRIQLRDVSNMSVKDMEPLNMFTFYDGTYTYIYDYFRKDYALIENSDHKTTSVELPLMTTLTVGESISCGLYDASGKEGLTSILSYEPEEDDNITIIKYVINWNSTQSKFNAKCYLLDPSHTIIAQTETPVQIDGPCGIYIKLPGLIEISKFIDVYAIKNISARYTRFNTAASEADYSMADESVYWRDSFHAYNEAAHKYGEFIMFGAGQFKEFEDFVAAPRNYYMTNGKFRFTVDRTESGSQYGLPYGEWTLGWADKEGKDIISETITETSSKYITSVQFLRENVYGMSIMIKYNDDTYTHHHSETAQSRDDYGSMGIVYTAETSFNMKPFNMIEYNGVYERSSNIDVATADSYGAVKIDNDTIKVNTSGQIYTTNSGGSYTAGQGIEIDNSTIKAKVDGTTISFNNSGELVASGGGGTIAVDNETIFINSDGLITAGESSHYRIGKPIFDIYVDDAQFVSYNSYLDTAEISSLQIIIAPSMTINPESESYGIAFDITSRYGGDVIASTEVQGCTSKVSEIIVNLNTTQENIYIDFAVLFELGNPKTAEIDITEYLLELHRFFGISVLFDNDIVTIDPDESECDGEVAILSSLLTYDDNVYDSDTIGITPLGYLEVNTANSEFYGVVKIDNNTILINGDGLIYAVGGSSNDTFIAVYPTTSIESITAAYNAGKTIFCKYTNDNTTCIMNLDYAGTNAEGNAYYEFSSVDTDKYLNCVSIDSLNGWGEVMHYSIDGGSGSSVMWIEYEYPGTATKALAEQINTAIQNNKIIALKDLDNDNIAYLNYSSYNNTASLWTYDFIFMENDSDYATIGHYRFRRNNSSQPEGGEWINENKTIPYEQSDKIKKQEDRITELEYHVKELTALVEKLTITEESETEEPKVKE